MPSLPSQRLLYYAFEHSGSKCWFLRRGENRSTRGKTSRSRERTNNLAHVRSICSGNKKRVRVLNSVLYMYDSLRFHGFYFHPKGASFFSSPRALVSSLCANDTIRISFYFVSINLQRFHITKESRFFKWSREHQIAW